MHVSIQFENIAKGPFINYQILNNLFAMVSVKKSLFYPVIYQIHYSVSAEVSLLTIGMEQGPEVTSASTIHCKPIPCNDYRDLPV